MIHVPDVRATIDWYKSLDFNVVNANEDNGKIDWAMLSFGDSAVMFNAGGQNTTSDRRDVDLYVHTDNVSDLYERLRERVEVREELHDTFYGMREFIIRDLNGFWVTFGQEVSQTQAGTTVE
jgi:uncharacterized glyoxalase superfamily protein PhnB